MVSRETFSMADLDESKIDNFSMSKLPPPRPLPSNLAAFLSVLSLPTVLPPSTGNEISHQDAPSSSITLNPSMSINKTSQVLQSSPTKSLIQQLSTMGIDIQEKLKLSHSQHFQQHQQIEDNIKSEIDMCRQSAFGQFQLREEKLKQELLDQKLHYEQILQTKEDHNQQLLYQKDQRIAELKRQMELDALESKRKLSERENFYVQQLTTVELQSQIKIQETEQRWQEKIRQLQDQLNTDLERRKLVEKSRLEAKEKELQHVYEKKVKKCTKQVEAVIQHYKDKELIIQGGLDEARREILHLQAANEARIQSHREELQLKDKRLVEIHQELDEVDDLRRQLENWIEIADTLSVIVLQTCGTVEELPAELWSGTTPGLFSSVWDEIRNKKVPQGHGKVTLDGAEEDYREKRKTCVICSKAMLAKCLRLSKTIHEKIKSDQLTAPKSTIDVNAI